MKVWRILTLFFMLDIIRILFREKSVCKMFELDCDLDLDENFLEEVLQTENEFSKKKEAEAEKRSSPIDNATQSSKKHRFNYNNCDSDNEIKGCEESGVSNSCLPALERKTLKELSHFESSNDLRFSGDIFLCDEKTEDVHQSIGIPKIVISPHRPVIRQRKFPGPAGLLPERVEMLNQSVLPTLAASSEDPMCSQSSSSVFESTLWLRVMSDFVLTDKSSPLSQLNIKWMKRRAAAKQLSDQKVPFLVLVLHDMDCSSPDPCVTLRDPTGEIHGTLHREIWEQYGGQLEPGTVLVLRQVGVLSTGVSTRRHYLNVTSNNILNIYSNGEGGIVRNTTVHKMSHDELLKSVFEWQSRTLTADTSLASSSMFNVIGPRGLATPQTLYSTVGSSALRERTNLSPMPVSPQVSANQFVKKVSPRTESSIHLSTTSHSTLSTNILSATPKRNTGASNFNSQLQEVTKQVTSSPVFKGGFTPKMPHFRKVSTETANPASPAPSPIRIGSSSASIPNSALSQNSSTPISNSKNSTTVTTNLNTIPSKCKENESVFSSSHFQQQNIDVLEGLDASCLFDDF